MYPQHPTTPICLCAFIISSSKQHPVRFIIVAQDLTVIATVNVCACTYVNYSMFHSFLTSWVKKCFKKKDKKANMGWVIKKLMCCLLCHLAVQDSPTCYPHISDAAWWPDKICIQADRGIARTRRRSCHLHTALLHGFSISFEQISIIIIILQGVVW